MTRWFLTLLAALAALTYVIHAAEPPGDPEPPRPVTAADLHAVRKLTWGGQDWPMSLDADGRYYCGPPLGAAPEGDTRFWAGTWALAPGGTVTLQEGHYRCPPDRAPEEVSPPRPVTLTLSWERGKLRGHGWGQSLTLER